MNLILADEEDSSLELDIRVKILATKDTKRLSDIFEQ
jgi:hypothetical protein